MGAPDHADQSQQYDIHELVSGIIATHMRYGLFDQIFKTDTLEKFDYRN
ncbi:hypothetical protein [Methylotuvimicrobium buryatense]|nr:hypothetical protein [Methylotuvimicrobium buryatense]